MKKIVLFVFILNLIGCLQDNPCEKVKYKLNEPGGFGRNEVTCLIDGETVWHSSRIVTNGGGMNVKNPYKFYIRKSPKKEKGRIVEDSLGQIVYTDYFEMSLETFNSSECKNERFYHYQFIMKMKGFNDNIDTVIDCDLTIGNNFMYENKPGYSNYYFETDFKTKVYLNRKDSIVYGTFEGTLYETERINMDRRIIDSIKITSGVFDYKFDYRHVLYLD